MACELMRTDKVTVSFGGLIALKDVDFSVASGEIVGLIGPNGSGKSTLFNVLNGLNRPTRGDIFFEGKPVTGVKPHVLSRLGVGRTFQALRLLNSETVLNNLLLGYHKSTATNLLDVLFRTGKFVSTEKELAALALQTLEFVGLKGLADTNVAKLSHSQRRRLEVARALATGPKVLLLDEPAAGMNPVETEELMGLVNRIRDTKQVSVVIIEHDMKVIMGLAGRVFVLNHGQKIAEGTPREIRNNQVVIEAYLGSGYSNAQN